VPQWQKGYPQKEQMWHKTSQIKTPEKSVLNG